MKTTLLLLLLTPLALVAQLSVSQVTDINTGATGSRTSAPGTAYQGLLFFPATSAENGTELWVSDGTADGTSLLVDLVPGVGSSNPEDLTVVGDQLFFTAEAAATGRELYRTDGTAAGTSIVSDIQPGAGSSIPAEGSRAFVAYDDRIYFAAAANDNNVELWSAAGGAAFLVNEIRSGSQGSFPDNLTVANGALFFTADDDISGEELWFTTGNPSSTARIFDAYPGGQSGSPEGLTVVNDKLFFIASNSFAAGDLYVYDLVAGGTQRVFDFSGRGTDLGTNTSRSPVARLGDEVVFAAENGNGADLWISDGTEAGTRVLLDNPETGFGGYTPQFLVSVGEFVYFKDDTNDAGIELWRTDGTTEGTILTKDLDDSFFDSIFLPSYLHGHEGRLYFGADGDVVDGFGSTGIEVYVSDGTNEGTVLAADINQGSSDADPNNFVSVGEQLFFFADNGTDGQELFVLTNTPGVVPLTIGTVQQFFVRCNGQSNGSLEFTVSGGVPPYRSGDITSESGEFTIPNLLAGDYNLVVLDARDSTLSISVTVPEPSRLNVLLDVLTGQNTLEGGSIVVRPSGGIPPYSFTWADTSLTTNIREDLAFGDYTVTVTDANGCETTETYTVDDLTSTTQLAAGAFRLYPTLVTDRLNVELTGGLIIEQVSCTDLNGRLLSTTRGNGQAVLSLDGSFLPQAKGTYLISVVTTSGERGIRRIVVAR